jgi:flagellar basal body-associated protein FliL
LATNNNQPKTILYILVLIIVVITFIALGLIALNYPKFNSNVINKNQTQTKAKVEIAQPTISIDPNPDITVLNQQADSDEVEAIKADLSATDLNNIDKEVENISVELNQ